MLDARPGSPTDPNLKRRWTVRVRVVWREVPSNETVNRCLQVVCQGLANDFAVGYGPDVLRCR